MPELTISSLRGGLNEDPPISLRPDQCTVAENIEWNTSAMGERRHGALAIDAGPFADCAVSWLYRHLPTTNLADAQLWAFGFTALAVPVLAYKDTTWHTVTMPDAPVINNESEYHVSGRTLHGKLFIAYHSAVDRLHVWDGLTLRRCGLAGTTPPPTMADTGSGSFSETRYYRVRWITYDAQLNRIISEPTEADYIEPSGTGSGVIVTRPATGPGEGEGYWRLEASLNNGDWYVIADSIPLATTTQTDENGNYSPFVLSEDYGDYTPIPSVKFLSVDEDRLICAGHWTEQSLQSRVMWTPVYGSTGYNNDERLALSTNPYLDLDNYEGGALSGISSNVNGYLYATKFHHIYQLTRTGVRTKAYEAIPLTKQRGALISSLVEGFDQAGQPFVFCLDPDIGPIRIGGPRGIEPCGADLVRTWERINLDAVVPARALYYPERRQIHWWIALDADQLSPNYRLVLHTHLMRSEPEGARGGYSVFTGASSGALAACMFADNVDDNEPRSLFLKPVVGFYFGHGDDSIWRTDVGNNDNGVAYLARMQSKPFGQGGMLNAFEVGEAIMLAAAAAGAIVDITIRGLRADKATVEKTIPAIDLTLRTGELPDAVLRAYDNLSLAEMQTVQVDLKDSTGSSGAWAIHQISLSITGGQTVRAA